MKGARGHGSHLVEQAIECRLKRSAILNHVVHVVGRGFSSRDCTQKWVLPILVDPEIHAGAVPVRVFRTLAG